MIYAYAPSKKTKKTPLFAINLDRTAHPSPKPGHLRWDENWLHWVGIERIDCSSFDCLDPVTAHSLKDHLITFAATGKYALSTLMSAAQSINTSLTQHPTHIFDKAWVLLSLPKAGFLSSVGTIYSIFKYWSDRYPNAITSEALHLLAKPRARFTSRNVLSDDPEKSWLTDLEYDALLQRVWENYDRGITGTQVTLLRLLSMQYARRPVQFAQLKIGDFRDGPAENGISGRRIHFPGAKDHGAEASYRDSKEEVHPVADHLWELFHIQKYEVKALIESTLGITLNAAELELLPVFINRTQLRKATHELTNHYRVNWRANLDNRLFHTNPTRIASDLRWISKASVQSNFSVRSPHPPFSHRTGKPMVVSANRMRHTRARQLARLGMPKHILSFWLGHTSEKTLAAYYNDPAEEARQIDQAMGKALTPLAMSFTGKLLDEGSQATRAGAMEARLEVADAGDLKEVGSCGKHSFCASTTVPVPCYRCRYFEPLVHAPHHEVLAALLKRQSDENAVVKIGGSRRLLIPIDLSADIRAVRACVERCNERKLELKEKHE